ncbi:hypothetical protein HQ576_19065, partial [bacterium]|nr:hypothetical protein [bacterium]
MSRASVAFVLAATLLMAWCPAHAAAPPSMDSLGAKPPPSAIHAIRQLVAQLVAEAPATSQALAAWQWKDDSLPAAVRDAFRDDLEVALIQSGRFRYFHRDRFRQVLKEHRLTLGQLVDPAAMQAVAAAGIDSFLSVEILDTSAGHPEYDGLDTHTAILAKVTDARTAAVVWAAYVEGANPKGVRALFGAAPPKAPIGGMHTTRYRQLATAIAGGLHARLGRAGAIKTITLSTPPKDATAGIGIVNPHGAPFDLKQFEDELLLAIVATKAFAYVDPGHIAQLVAQWTQDGEAAAAAGKQALAQKFSIDGYLFGTLRSGDATSTRLSMRLVSLKDGSEAWAGKYAGSDTVVREPRREPPQPPVPRGEPVPPVELSLEDIERPLKPPIPRPELAEAPPSPQADKSFNLFGTLFYPVLGLPRDAVDLTFLTADRVPLAGAVTSVVYRYSGLGFLCRIGTGRRFRRDLSSSRALTYGQLRSRDQYPTLMPLVQSAKAHPNRMSSYLLQVSLFTLAVGDVFDATTLVLDRTPLLGTLTTPVLLPFDYAWRMLPDDRDIYLPQVTPGRPESRLTFGSLATQHGWSALPNTRAWPFLRSSRRAQREALARFVAEDTRIRKQNDALLSEWHTAEQSRTRYNTEALATLRKRNLDARRKYEGDLARVRRDNQTDQSRYERDKQAVAD